MRLTMLYLRSRLAGYTAAVLVAIAAVTWVWAWWSGSAAAAQTLLPLAMPLAAAGAIGASTGSPFGEGEVTGSRPLGPLRFWHLMGLLAVAMVVLALAATRWSVSDGAWTLLRNLAGFTGLALLTARVLGSGLSWVVPLGYAVLSLLAPQPVSAAAWAWPMQAAADQGAAAFALALLLAGVSIIVLSGARAGLPERV